MDVSGRTTQETKSSSCLQDLGKGREQDAEALPKNLSVPYRIISPSPLIH